MSQTPIVEHLAIPACRQDGNARVCVGPPTTLPHTVAGLDVVAYHTEPGHVSTRCGTCRATATHVNTCPTCRATLTRCFRSGCAAAWMPFEVLVTSVAKGVINAQKWPAGTFSRDEVLDLAAGTGMVRILGHHKYSPEHTITDTKKLTSYLFGAMEWAITDWRRHNYAPLDADPDPEDNHVDPDEHHGPGRRARRGPTDVPQAPGDITGIDARRQIRLISGLLQEYADSQDAAHRFVFGRWYTTRRDPTRILNKVSQQKIADEMRTALGTAVNQGTISRWMSEFPNALEPLITNPDNGLTQRYRDLALRLIRGVETPPAPAPNTPETTPEDRGVTSPTPAPAEDSEGHDD